MKKTALSLLILICFNTISIANDLFTFSLAENQKFQQTQSVNLGNDGTLHFVITKNKDSKKYDLLAFYVNANQTIKQMETTSHEELPEIISYHYTKNNITILNYNDETLTVIDYNAETGKVNSDKLTDFKKPKTIFRLPNKTFFLDVDRKGEQMTVTKLENANSIISEQKDIPEKYQKVMRRLFKETIEEVYTNEYVKNGSIAEFQAYYENEKFIIVKNDEMKDFIETFEIDPKTPDLLSIKEFNLDKIDRLKNRNSFINDGKLFSILMGKEDFNITINNLQTGKEEKSLFLSKDILKSSISEQYKAFLKEAKRNKNTSTLAVNNTKDGNYSVTVDYVDAVSYNYHHNWFIHQQLLFHQNMYMLHKQIQQMSIPSGFNGPNPEFYNHLDNVYFKKEKQEAITFLLSNQFDVIENATSVTEHKFVDKEKYTEELDENKEIKNYSIGFLENEYRYIYTDKKEETIYIKFKAIK